MEEAVRQRINEYIKSKRFSVNALSKIIDVNQKTLNNQLTGSSSLNVNTVCAIIEKFPDLSTEWLLRGAGAIEGIKRTERTNKEEGVEKSLYIQLMERQLEEEKKRSQDYWNTIQKLIGNGQG